MTVDQVSASGLTSEAPPGRFVQTPMQQVMLFETMIQQRPWTNLQQIVCRLDEPIDMVRLQQAWEAAQSKHAVLRSSFEWEGLPAPEQLIHQQASIPFE